MKSLIKTFLVLLCIIIPSSAHSISMKLNADEVDHIRVFYHDEDVNGWNAILKGKIISIGTREDSGVNEIAASARDRSKATVRLYSHEGVKPGDQLFVINEKNLIMSRLTVISVFYTPSFGYLMTGHGNFRLSVVGNRVVQKIEDENSQYAFIHRARGDYYLAHGDLAEARSMYQKSIELDKGNPESHMALGYIYLNENLLPYAFREFQEAYRNISRLYDNDDRYQLLKGMTETRYREVYHSSIPNKLKSRYISDGIKYGNEALRIHPSSKEVNYYLGVFYYRNADPSDSKARDHMLKVIEEDPGNIDPYIILSELYYNHKNMEKASFYAMEALKIDPGNERARYIRQLINKQ